MEKDFDKGESRRRFLKTAGKFAIYTPPALMVMSNANAKYMKCSVGVIRKRKRNNGYGNGDQRAPGRSFRHNQAENGPKQHRRFRTIRN